MLAPGIVLNGRYQLTQRIAAGGMGEVWRGSDLLLQREIAVKVLLPALMADEQFITRFRAEARMMAALRHPGIVQVYDYGENAVVGNDRLDYLVMEFVEGTPLAKRIQQAGRLGVPETMTLVAQVADALQAAHEAGIIHRDVKPSNLLVRRNGAIVLVDFGVARSIGVTGITSTNVVMGSAHYMAPEQAEGKPVSAATDVYALGAVAFSCLAGRPPYVGDNPLAVLAQLVHGQPPTLPDDLPAAVGAVVLRSLAREPSQRFASAAALAEAARAAAQKSSAPHAQPFSAPHAQPFSGPHAQPFSAPHSRPSSAPHSQPGPAQARSAGSVFGGASPVPPAPGIYGSATPGQPGSPAYGSAGFGQRNSPAYQPATPGQPSSGAYRAAVPSQPGFGSAAVPSAPAAGSATADGPAQQAGRKQKKVLAVVAGALVLALGGTGIVLANQSEPSSQTQIQQPPADGEGEAQGQDVEARENLPGPAESSKTKGGRPAKPNDPAPTSPAAGAQPDTTTTAAPDPGTTATAPAPGTTDTSTAQPTTTTTTTPAQPEPTNPYSATQVCGSGYKVIDSAVLKTSTGVVKGRVYLLYANSGKNCVVTMKTASVGKKTATAAYLEVKGKSRVTDSGSFAYYAGPISAAAAATCVKWGGSVGAAAYASPFEHCD